MVLAAKGDFAGARARLENRLAQIQVQLASQPANDRLHAELGEVEALLVYSPTEGNSDATDPIDRMNCRTDFQMVIYPGPLGTPTNAIPATAPPAFFVIANDDTSHMKPVLAQLQQYEAAKRPVEVHIYAKGGHGFNLGKRSKLASIRDWPQRMADWMGDNGYLKSSSNTATNK